MMQETTKESSAGDPWAIGRWAVILTALLFGGISSAWAMSGTKNLGTSCNNNNQCKSGFCDAGWGTSKTDKCVPGPAKGDTDDYCSNDNQCKTGKCAGLKPNSSGGWIAGKCTGKRDLGKSCGANSECKSGFCDAGSGTSKTNKCVPGPAKGNPGDYCSHDNQCKQANCKGLRPNNSGGWIAGTCDAKQSLGDSCMNNGQCASGVCDAGSGTSKTNSCVPKAAMGATGNHCSHDNQCKSGLCQGLKPKGDGSWVPGTCGTKLELGKSCTDNAHCASGVCDAGWNTSKTNKCVPTAGKGTTGDFCSNDNQCSSMVCDGLKATDSGDWKPGKCGAKYSLAAACTAHHQCRSNSCDPREGCVPAKGKGALGDYCSHDNQCSSSHCGGLLTRSSGACEPQATDPKSYFDKTRIFIQNDTNQWLLLEDFTATPSLGWETGRHFDAKRANGEVRRHPEENGYPLRHAGHKAVPPGERVEVAWFQRAGLRNGKDYSFRVKVGIGAGTNESVILKSKLRGKPVGSAIWFGLDDSQWFADTSWHQQGKTVQGTTVVGRRWNASKKQAEDYTISRDQKVLIKYRGLTRPGLGGDIEYVFVGPQPPVKLTFPVTPRANVMTGEKFIGPFHMDHNPWPRTNSLACSDYAGRGNDLKGVHCYGNHEGNDFGLVEGFKTMQTKDTWVVATAAGTVLEVVDGHPDQCGLNLAAAKDLESFIKMLESPTCPPEKANRIVIDHGDGIVTQYLHLARNSITVKPGNAVRCGQRIGKVGSSGRSVMPHLHFDVVDNGSHVDPFGGLMSTRSYWQRQGSGRVPAETCRDSSK